MPLAWSKPNIDLDLRLFFFLMDTVSLTVQSSDVLSFVVSHTGRRSELIPPDLQVSPSHNPPPVLSRKSNFRMKMFKVMAAPSLDPYPTSLSTSILRLHTHSEWGGLCWTLTFMEHEGLMMCTPRLLCYKEPDVQPEWHFSGSISTSWSLHICV